jgi:hypothetical protein
VISANGLLIFLIPIQKAKDSALNHFSVSGNNQFCEKGQTNIQLRERDTITKQPVETKPGNREQRRH